jgi:hypothetical protein
MTGTPLRSSTSVIFGCFPCFASIVRSFRFVVGRVVMVVYHHHAPARIETKNANRLWLASVGCAKICTALTRR